MEHGPHLLSTGQYFAGYRIFSLLGTGGMAEVYLAKRSSVKRACALKVMKPSVYRTDTIFQQRFLREMEIGSALAHPNIAKVYECGRDEASGLFFIVMEYVDGVTLDQELQRGPLSLSLLYRVAFEMADVLQELHRHGIVHRDIKPSNIIRRKNGSLCLLDLGIARIRSSIDQDMTLTCNFTSLGTIDFASPEQLRSAHDADITSDIYSLGATLYYLATGRMPFAGENSAETMINICDPQVFPASIQQFRTDIPPEFCIVIYKMLCKNPSGRYGLPNELKEALRLARNKGRKALDGNIFSRFIHTVNKVLNLNVDLVVLVFILYIFRHELLYFFRFLFSIRIR